MPYIPKPYNLPESMQQEGFPKAAFETTTLGKIMDVLGTTERLSTKYLLTPLAKTFADKDTLARLEALDMGGFEGESYAGDLLRAVHPYKGEGEESLQRKIALGIGGAVLGAAVDPLSYVAPFGALTRAGKAVSPLAKSSSLAKQAAAGERALVHAALPWKVSGVPLVKGKSAFKVADLLQSGKTLEKTIGRIGPIHNVAKTLDSSFSSLARKFNFPIGVDMHTWRLTKSLQSEIAGTTAVNAEEAIQGVAPHLSKLVDHSVDTLGMDRGTALENWKAFTTEMYEVARAGKVASLGSEGGAPKFFQGTKRAKSVGALGKLDITEAGGTKVDIQFEKLMQDVYPTYPGLGGPGSPMDSEMIRLSRMAVIAVNREAINTTAKQVDHLNHAVRLWSDKNYLYNLATPEFLDALNPKGINQLFGLGQSSNIQVKHLEAVTRRLRYIDGVEAQSLIKSGLIPKTIPINIQTGKNVFKEIPFDLHKAIADNEGMLITKEIADAIDVGIERKMFGEDMANTIGRAFPTPTHNQANDLINQFGIGKIKPGQIEKAFHDDPMQLLVARGAQADRDILSAQYYDDILKRVDPGTGERLAVPIKDQKLHEYAKDWVPVDGVRELAGHVVEPGVARHLAFQNKSDIYLTEHLNKFFRGAMKATNWQKSWVLAPFPAYHTRNFFQNMWQYFMGEEGGMRSFTTGLTDSMVLMRNMRNANHRTFIGKHEGTQLQAMQEAFGNLYDATSGTISTPELAKYWHKNRALGIGFIRTQTPEDFQKVVRNSLKNGPRSVEKSLDKAYRAEFHKSFQGLSPPRSRAEAIKHGISEVAGTDARFVRKGFKVGQAFDDHIRIAHMLNRLRQGNHPVEAMSSMKKYFYDYHDLSPLERDVMKLVFPFYTWSRKNIPFYMEAMLTHPGKVARFGSFTQGATGDNNPRSEALVNDWMRKNYPLRIRKGKDGKYQYFMFKNWMGIADIQDVANLWQFARTSLNPFARVPMELMWNQNFFTERQLDRFAQGLDKKGFRAPFTGGETERMFSGRGLGFKESQGVRLPKKIAHVLKSFRLTKTLNDITENPQELEPLVMLLSQLPGIRTYPLDPTRSYLELSRDLREIQRNTKSAVRSAVYRDASPGEIARLIRMGQEKTTKRQKGIRPQLEGR